MNNSNHHTASHRCQELLHYNENNLPVFIRYGWRYMHSQNVPSEKRGWHLYSVETDDETWRNYSYYIATIKYCPFCGQELEMKK